MSLDNRYIAAVIALGVMVTVACGGGDGTAPASTPTAAATPIETAPATPSAVPSASATPEFSGDREPVMGGDDASGAGLLTDVRAAGHDGFDRIVFEFEDVLPGYAVQYVTPPVTACGSGEPVDIAGAAILQVRFYPANAHTEAGDSTLPSQELTPGLASLLEAKSACDFEAVVVWAMGLTEEVDFEVTELTDPIRLVIDVAHP